LRREVSRFCKTLPRKEEYRLKDQIIRSSRSVTANIAEGYGRHHHKENIQFCRTARGSLTETLDHLIVALDDEYLTKEEHTIMRGLLENTHKVLNGYIAYLKRCASGGVPKD
ncbi:MAG: four helix bundle protein, partial [Verrucomicrobia bacterium]